MSLDPDEVANAVQLMRLQLVTARQRIAELEQHAAKEPQRARIGLIDRVESALRRCADE